MTQNVSAAPAGLLRIEDLHTQIRSGDTTVHVVNGVDLHVDRGEVLGIVGESGSGKTLTALSVMRLLPHGGRITGGRIMLDGRDLVPLSESGLRRVRGGEIGMVFQDPMSSLNPTMAIGDQVAEAVRLHRRVSRRQAAARAVEVLDQVGMPAAARRVHDYPHQLSGGMRQRVMIAIALACEPKLLIADEPTTALDVTIQKQILGVIDRLRRELDMGVVLVTHDLGVVAGYADRVAVMYGGRIVETAATDELYGRERHPYTAALFDALPERAVNTGEPLRTIPGQPPDLSSPITGCAFAPRCVRATDRCRAEFPAVTVEAGGHAYHCFVPLEHVGAAPRAAVAEPAAGRPSDEAPVVVELVDLHKEFPVNRGVLQRRVGSVSAVAGVSLSIRAGQTFGLVGESGCGKTTIGRILAGLERPTSGRVLYHGDDLAGLRGARRKRLLRGIQFMFQDSYAAMDPRMRAGSILAEPMRVQRSEDRTARRARVEELLGQVGMARGAVRRYPHEFSGGQRQRLGLARALALRPELVVADEPVSALDVSIQAQILNLMRDLQRQTAISYVVISHDLSVVRYISDVIGVMYLGKLVEVGPAEIVYGRPAHPYTRALIDTVPVADPPRERARRNQVLGGEIASATNPPSGCRFRTRCPYAADVCASSEPPLRPLGPGLQSVACHFPLEVSPDGST
ncbi:ABC transporter ATP-binding protein [Planotetraspora mira]|uniref:Oligopeptide ABC transporter ATP-binding protein OppF n=1 Tax=Planotetraspora mira TaxID=58121 RepID=A0A8J3X8I0_9ACTN|nr:ABC transporter ATP-binding protein [Planotetraspora mira]GII31775.1 oligopeptide ABC transporter ATP-binding protein OppF [Planotetraspora mira]